jgi:hypothetical protein
MKNYIINIEKIDQTFSIEARDTSTGKRIASATVNRPIDWEAHQVQELVYKAWELNMHSIHGTAEVIAPALEVLNIASGILKALNDGYEVTDDGKTVIK